MISSESEEEYRAFRKLFHETYPIIDKDGEPLRMPFQGAWPIDLWKLEATISEHPELWWGLDLSCEISPGCQGEVAGSYLGKHRCRAHLLE